MHLRDFFSADAVGMDLIASSKDEALIECVRLLQVDERTQASILNVLRRREQVGSTGFGRGIAIPHCRSMASSRLRVAYGHFRSGVDFDALDKQPVYHVFLIAAPPSEISNQYLQVLAHLARFARDPAVSRALNDLRQPSEFLSLIDAHGA